MDLSAENYKSDERHRLNLFIEVVQHIRGFISRLARFFTITEEELSNAGIGTKVHD